jgi:voltage-gated potassium channel Kch
MADARHYSLSLRKLILGVRLFLAVIAIVSLILGYVGLRIFIMTNPRLKTTTHTPGDLIYFDAELFLLQSTPLADGGHIPWQLQVARFSVPSTALYAIAELGIALFAGRIQRARIRRFRDHAIICGSGRAVGILSTRLREGGMRVVTVVEEQFANTAGQYFVVGDPRLDKTLLDAGLDRAAVVYACYDRSEENAQIAGLVERIRAGRRRPEKIYALIDDLELCAALKARRWSLAGSDLRHVDFFNPDELAAQAIVRRDGPAFAGEPPEIAIIGTGAFGRSVLVEFARQWSSRRGTSGRRMKAILIGPDAEPTVAKLNRRYRFLDEACQVQPYPGSLEHLIADRRYTSAPRLRRLYVCQDDEREALETALSSAANLQPAIATVVVRLDQMSGMAKAFHDEQGGSPLLDSLGGRLEIVDVVAEGCDPLRIGDDLAENLARACHRRYLMERIRSGAEPGSSPSLVGWEELSADLQAANRAQAMDNGSKLAAIDCLIALHSETSRDFEFLDAEIELLAQWEHARWTDERLGQGWVYDSQRDDTKKRHPDLVPWARLPEEDREKDRQVIRAIPGILADVGLGIVRIGSAEALEVETPE